MVLGFWGIPFLVFGLLLASDYRGFTESVFRVLSGNLPTSRSARPGNLRVVGAGFVVIGAFFFIGGFSGALK
ncbi:hypothetical protein G3260_003983 [Streptomyces albus]|uniref:hypothetical protein n=1 Tax=Streptomyces TaxID=1883 RepID=UPI0013B47E42|nr:MULTISPECIES: hypothetical protein [Streptomyces]QID37529.1 hypothetical protein G3260_003983 [Streptomyces albus]